MHFEPMWLCSLHKCFCFKKTICSNICKWTNNQLDQYFQGSIFCFPIGFLFCLGTSRLLQGSKYNRYFLLSLVKCFPGLEPEHGRIFHRTYLFHLYILTNPCTRGTVGAAWLDTRIVRPKKTRRENYRMLETQHSHLKQTKRMNVYTVVCITVNDAAADQIEEKQSLSVALKLKK